MTHYQPPKQGKVSQLIDVIVLVVLTVGALFVPIWLKMAGAAKVSLETLPTQWDQMNLNEAQIAKYQALGFTEPTQVLNPDTGYTVANLITDRFDYSFSVGALVAMIAVILLYYFLILRFSEVEYREVISEKFGE
jgi:cytochrome c-type biogenesis protein CcmH/NrfG